MRTLSILTLMLVAAAVAQAAEPPRMLPATAPEMASKKAEPGLAYGKSPDLPLPKTVIFSVGPDEILADAEEWARHGVNAFFLDFVAREWSNDIWAADGKPWTIGASDETLQKVRKATDLCRRIGSDVFLKVSFDHFFEWFNDVAWQRIDNNFRQFAIFARDSGCTGVALDIEYVGEQYRFGWEGYTYDGYTRADLIAKIRERMTGVMRILYDEFPDMVFLTFPEQGLSLGAVIHTAWVEEAARRDAPGGIHYCTEYTYRSPNIRYMLAHAWVCNDLFHRLLSEKAWKYWTAKCSISAGVWPFGFDYQTVYEPGMPLDEFRQEYAASLMMSSRYNWIYSHNCRAQLIGRDLDKYKGDGAGTADLKAYLKVIADRDIVTTPKYVALAKELRTMQVRDYSNDLDLVPYVGFMAPGDVPSVRLMPVAMTNPAALQANWNLAMEYYAGAAVNFHERFGTQTHWMLIGPFPSDDKLSGHNVVYPPETAPFSPGAEYDGVNGKVRWTEYQGQGSLATIDLTKVFQPPEKVCAYALCYVTSPAERQVQFRLGTNDSGKLWVGGQLVFDYPYEGTVFLDRDIVPVTLPAGTTPILLKVCNALKNWGFVFRITEADGTQAKGLQFSVAPPK